MLRLEENCIEKVMITPKILKHSQIALLALDGNLFPAKDFPHLEGYEEVSFTSCTESLMGGAAVAKFLHIFLNAIISVLCKCMILEFDSPLT